MTGNELASVGWTPIHTPCPKTTERYFGSVGILSWRSLVNLRIWHLIIFSARPLPDSQVTESATSVRRTYGPSNFSFGIPSLNQARDIIGGKLLCAATWVNSF